MISESLQNQTSPIIRYLAVGILNTCAGLSIIFLLMNVFGVSYWHATFIGNVCGATISYLLNKSFTFKSKTTYRRSVPLFLLVILSCYLLSYSSSKWITEFIIYNLFHSLSLAQYYNEIAVLIGATIYTITNYLGQRNIVFT